MIHIDHLTTEVRWALGAILLLLVIASAVVFAMRRLQPDRDRTELVQRVRTWWFIAGFSLLSLVLNRRGFLWFLGFVSFLALKEFFTLVATRRSDRRVLFWAYLAIPFQYYWVHVAWYGMFIIFIPVYLFLLIPTRLVTAGETQGFLRSAGIVHWGLMTTVFSLSHAAYLLVLEHPHPLAPRVAWNELSPESAASPGPGLLIFLVALTQLNDVAQYVWGKLLGRRKVAPHVSPGKTLAGFVGGAATTVLIAWLAGPRLTLMDGPRALLAGAIIAVAGFAGDLSISALKRDLGVKDSGDLLPGHGGILDRVDSLTYTAPLFFHYIYYCYF